MSKDHKSTISPKSTIIKKLYKSPKWKEKLLNIMGKSLKATNITEQDIIDVIGKNTKSDKAIFEQLTKLNHQPKDLYTEEYDIKRAFSKWRFIKPKLTKRIGSILDMGGNVGNIARCIGHRILRLPKEKIYVVDITEWEGHVWVPRKDITFIHYDNMKDIPDGSIDLITLFHTFHHIPMSDYPSIFKHFYRILSPGGNIVLFEHDCAEKNWAGLIDLEHALFDVVVSKKKTYTQFVKAYYAKYLSLNKWIKLFTDAGFKKYHIYELHNSDNSAFIYFKKD